MSIAKPLLYSSEAPAVMGGTWALQLVGVAEVRNVEPAEAREGASVTRGALALQCGCGGV
jgi:hypothetical protein